MGDGLMERSEGPGPQPPEDRIPSSAWTRCQGVVGDDTLGPSHRPIADFTLFSSPTLAPVLTGRHLVSDSLEASDIS